MPLFVKYSHRFSMNDIWLCCLTEMEFEPRKEIVQILLAAAPDE